MPVTQGGVYAAQLVSDTDLTGTTVTLAVTKPDGTLLSPAPSVTPSGKIATATVQAALVGTYLLVWTTTGAVSGVVQDQFTCEAPQADLISLPDLKEELNLSTADTSMDAKLRRWLKAATGVVENVTGPIRPHAVTDWFDGGTATVILSSWLVASITSVTELSGTVATVLTEQTFGVTPIAPGYVWDRVTNILTRRDASGYPAFFGWGTSSRAVQVVYQAGLTSIPDEVQLAATELIRHWYRKNDVDNRSGGGGGGWNGQGGDDMVMVGNYMVPNAVMELLEPWRRPPGIA